VGEDKCFILRLRKERENASLVQQHAIDTKQPQQPAFTSLQQQAENMPGVNPTTVPQFSSSSALLPMPASSTMPSLASHVMPTTLATTTAPESTTPSTQQRSPLPPILMRYSDSIGPGSSVPKISSPSGTAKVDGNTVTIGVTTTAAMSNHNHGDWSEQTNNQQQQPQDSGVCGLAQGEQSGSFSWPYSSGSFSYFSTETNSSSSLSEGESRVAKALVNCALEMNQSQLIIAPKVCFVFLLRIWFV
jgi:hypothetical protein